MRFVLFCEGHTERRALPAFLKRCLDPEFSQPVSVKPVRFDGWAELVKDAAVKADLYLNGPCAADVVGVIGLIDLYGPTIYPQQARSAPHRFDWMKNHVETRVGHPRFRMFCAVHEVEAWLLSQPELFPRAVAEALSGAASQPETIDFDRPPAKLLDSLYHEKVRRGYKKVVYGSDLFGRLDPEAARRKCPYLAHLLDDMLQLARDAGL